MGGTALSQVDLQGIQRPSTASTDGGEVDGETPERSLANKCLPDACNVSTNVCRVALSGGEAAPFINLTMGAAEPLVVSGEDIDSPIRSNVTLPAGAAEVIASDERLNHAATAEYPEVPGRKGADDQFAEGIVSVGGHPSEMQYDVAVPGHAVIELHNNAGKCRVSRPQG
jgi:hypothetical protein